jgi:hypothetical protein
MEKQKKYTKPEAEVVNFSLQDIITGSIPGGDVPDYPYGVLGEDE